MIAIVFVSVVRALWSILFTSDSVMLSGSTGAYRIVKSAVAACYAIYVLLQTVRPRRYAHANVVLFLCVALLLSLVSPHTIALTRVLIHGVEAYEPPPGLLFPYSSREELESAAVTTAVMHALGALFIASFALSKKVRLWFDERQIETAD